MAIEALVAVNRPFIHKPQHDLESILYIIFYICTFICGPGLPLSGYKLDITHPLSPPIRTWFCNNNIRQIGYLKLAHLECYHVAILPYFTPYWHDFTPFVKDLIVACFPSLGARVANKFCYDQALQILKTAHNFVGEPHADCDSAFTGMDFGPQCLTRTPKRTSEHDLDRDAKKGRHA